MRLEERTVLPAPPERVWAALVDWERQPRWMRDVAWVRVEGATRGLGARLRVRTKVFGIPAITDVLRVKAWDPPRLVVVRHEGPVRGTGRWRLDALGDGRTLLTWSERLSLPVPVVGELLLWLYRPWQGRMMARSTANLSRLARA
jgi:carbon monoxide dehydrogenase subunit G